MTRADPNIWFLILVVVSPIISALIAVAGVIATILFTNKRERDRQAHERTLKEAEVKATQDTRLRDERIAAYRKLLTAATLAHVDRDAVAELSKVYAEITLLAGSEKLDRAAARVWVAYGHTQKVADRMKKDSKQASAADFAQALDKARIAKEKFLELARKELGVEGVNAET